MITGLLSWALGRTADEIKRRVLSPDLVKRLDHIVSQWAKSVSDVAYIHPNALCPSTISAVDYQEDSPKLLHVRETLTNGGIPVEKAWFEALFEQWKFIKTYHKNKGDEAQAFFDLSEGQAAKHLAQLAKNIHDECTRETRIFNPHVVSSLDTLVKGINNINEQMQAASFPSEIGSEAKLNYRTEIPILDVPPLAKQLAQRKTAVVELYNKLSQVTWTAIHGEVGCGKTQLAVLLTHKFEKCSAWLSLRDCKTGIEAGSKLDAMCLLTTGNECIGHRRVFYRNACRALGKNTLIVIDDLVRLEGNDELSRRLALFSEACNSEGVSLLSTSNYQLPTQLLTQIGDSIVFECAVPPLDDGAIKELFSAHGAPQNLLTEEVISFFKSLGRNNATLIAALARHLKTKCWVAVYFYVCVVS